MNTSNRKFAFVVVLGIALSLFSTALSANVTVLPSGDLTGVTDQASIQTALEAEKNGGTVELAAGTFYLHKSIVVFDFDGTFKGAGSASTTVQTAPSVDFDVSASLDVLPGFPPARGLFASMFMFPYAPSEEAKTFRMSDMTIVVDQPAVDPPLDGFVDDRRAYLLNTMAAVLATNTDIIKLIIGEPFETINLDAVVEHVVVEGIQDPLFRGFYDEHPSDMDNSLFGAIWLFGQNVGNAAAIDVHVLNADFALNLSNNDETLYQNCVLQNAGLGIEHWDTPATGCMASIRSLARTAARLLIIFWLI